MSTSTSTRRGPRSGYLLMVAAPVAFGIAVIALWELWVAVFDVSPFIVPAPSDIWRELSQARSAVWDGMRTTGLNALYGLAIGTVLGVLGALIAHAVRAIDEMAVPIIAMLSVIPIVTLAPVLYTMFSAAAQTARVIVAALAVVIPVYLNTLRGLRQVAPVHRDLMAAYAASSPQVIRAVTLPTASPYVFTGLRVGSSLAVISALIAEYFGGPIGGLGKSITSAAAGSNYPLAWAYVLGSIVLGLAFFIVTLALETVVGRRRQSG